MASGDHEGRMLALLDALFQGQKRTLGLVEAAIEKFFIVETEMSKFNRKMNVVHEVAFRQHGEILDKIDEKFSAVGSEISRLSREMEIVHELAARRHGEIIGKFEAVAARLEETERLLDDHDLDIKRTQIELVGQYNEILTALQLSSNASQDVRDMDERLSELERRMQA